MTTHRDGAKKNKPCSSKIILQKDPKAYIELIEMFPCNSKEELNRREGEVIRATFNCVNKYVAGRTLKQWHEDNKDYNKTYYQDNREYLLQQKKDYLIANKEVINQKQRERYAKKKLESSISNESDSNPINSKSDEYNTN